VKVQTILFILPMLERKTPQLPPILSRYHLTQLGSDQRPSPDRRAHEMGKPVRSEAHGNQPSKQRYEKVGGKSRDGGASRRRFPSSLSTDRFTRVHSDERDHTKCPHLALRLRTPFDYVPTITGRTAWEAVGTPLRVTRLVEWTPPAIHDPRKILTPRAENECYFRFQINARSSGGRYIAPLLSHPKAS
jgi:hypothetical protein